jgi:sporulation protein YlmC with PRC-barrel domain
MKHSKITSLICGSVLSLAGRSLLAQQSSSTDSSSPSGQSSSSSSSQGSRSTQSSSSSTSMQSGSDVRLSQLMNSNVQSQEGKTLGHVRDVVIDPQSGRIDFAVLSLSSAGAAADTSTSGRETVASSRSSPTGIPSSSSGSTTSGKLIPVPWQLFSQSWNSSRSGSSSSASTSSGSQNLTLNMDESKLRSAPSFDMSDWNQLQQGSLDQRVYSYFGVDRSSALGTSGSSISGHGATHSF